MTAPELVQLRRAPFIDRVIDNTALASYMECPRKYYYSMQLNRRKRGLTRPALAYGTAWHAGMEAHFKTGGDAAAVDRAIIMAWEPHDDPSDHRTVDRCRSEYENYVAYYGGSFEAETQRFGATVGFPSAPMVEISTEISWNGALHPYAGKIDRIVEHNGLLLVEDHKTTKALGATYFRQFDPSNQMMGYAWLAQKFLGRPIAGVRINAHAVLKRESKFERQTVMFSPERLDEWAVNYNQWIKRLSVAGELLTAGSLGEAFPMQLNACAGKYGQCPYVDVCTSPIRSREKILAFDYDEFAWDPMHEAEDGVTEAEW